jgi:hypothetical protein
MLALFAVTVKGAFAITRVPLAVPVYPGLLTVATTA